MVEEIRYSRNKRKERYIKCRICNKQIQYNKLKKCKKCRQKERKDNTIEMTNNEEEKELQILKEQLGETIRYDRNINKINKELKNQGYIESQKHENSIRILALNPRGFGPKNNEKINMLKKAMNDYKIDIVLMSSTDRKWNELREETIKRKIKPINKNVEVVVSDSGEQTKTDNRYLPGGTLGIFTGRIVGMIVNEKTTVDRLGRWTSTRIEKGTKKMQIINVYRIPESTKSGVLTSKAQYDRVSGEVKTTREYRTDMLNELTEEIGKLKAAGVTGIILTGDMNQDITSTTMQRFIRENGFYELHEEVNETDSLVRDKTYKNGTKQIDVILGTEPILQATRGSKIIDFDEIIITDHRGFLFDVDVKEYFDINTSKYDKSETRKLNPANRRHRNEFKETLEQFIEQTKLGERTSTICNGKVTQHEMNVLDELITYVLSAARKKVEGVQRNIPYSITKQVKESKVKYIKGLINKKRGRRVDEGALNRRKEYCEIDMDDMDLPELMERQTEAVIEWEEHKKEAIEKEKEKLLEMYPTEIIGDTDDVKKKREQAIKSVKSAQYRQYSFGRLSRGVGKGNKRSLKQVREVDEQGRVVKEYSDREEIEDAIVKQNLQHFRQAFSSKAYKDKIYNKLQCDDIRDKILTGELEIDECDDSDVYKFLILLKRQNEEDQLEMSSEISEAEWERVVRKSKKKSASSIFSNRTYSVYKCALESNVMTKILVLFYSTLIKNGLYLK